VTALSFIVPNLIRNSLHYQQCSGLWSVDDNLKSWINEESSATVKVGGKRIDRLLEGWLQDGEVIENFKIDAEGSEMTVLKSALPYFKKNLVEHVMLEIAPTRTAVITPVETSLDIVEQLYSFGYYFERGNREISKEDMKATIKKSGGNPDNYWIHLRKNK